MLFRREKEMGHKDNDDEMTTTDINEGRGVSRSDP